MNNFKLCITVCMCTALLVLTNLASAQFSGGNGYSNNPWQIKNEGDFYGINDRNYIGMDNVNEPNVYFKLMNDITLNYPRGVPFGDLSNPFIGYFDGNGHTITIKSGGGSTLFGRLPGGIDQISTIENLTVYAEGSSGMIVLRNQGLIRNCKVYGTINAGNGEAVGALVNTNWGTINNCESFCTSVAGGGWTGGLVGDNTGGIITNCINHAPVSSNGYVGGIVGENDGAIEELAQHLKIGRTTFSGMINKEEGINYNLWMNTLRIDEAKKIFAANLDFSIAQVSEMVGFSEQSNFSRQFKIITKQSPSEWRQQNKATNP